MPDSASAFQKLHTGGAIQFDLPDMPPLPSPPGWLKTVAEFLARHEALVRSALWFLLALLAIFLLYRLWTFLGGRASLEAETASAGRAMAWQPDRSQARLTLTDAERLAAEGSFDRAAHLLLLVAVEEMRTRRPGLVAPALTSRDLARHSDLSPLARHVFGQIAALVEQSRFAGRTLSAEDFAQARGAFARFTEPASWQVAA